MFAQIHQSLQRPFGITAFGSSVIRAVPDIALLNFAVSRLEQRPREAFHQTHQAARTVGEYLAQIKMAEISTSRITLEATFEYTAGQSRFIGYTARIAFHVLLRDLDQTEEILIGITDAGVNEIRRVAYQTSHLKELRAQARRQAVAAAVEKAEIYCQAAGLTLGPVVHIEDVNPNVLLGHQGHVQREVEPEDDEPPRAFDPGSIIVSGAVLLGFELGRS